ncbi:MAG: hypothetical protein ACE5ET_08600 [Gammaproteobacteria bacterium]
MLGLLCLLPVTALAGEPERGQGETAPSLELLEFLGAWETPEGQWVDPLSLVRDEDGKAAPAAPRPDSGVSSPKAKVKRDD